MRRISIWITILVSVGVLGFAYWLNTSGSSAKPGTAVDGHASRAIVGQ